MIAGKTRVCRKKYTIFVTKKQLNIMSLYWNMFQAEYNIFWGKIGELEKAMSKKTGIKELEFFHDSMCTGWVGIGNASRTMRLFQQEELE